MDLSAIIAAVKHQAENEVPFECCGFIDDQGQVVKCQNVARDRTTNFEISPAEHKSVARRRTIAGVYHSHVDQQAYISVYDQAGMTFDGLYIVAAVLKGVARDVKVYLRKDGKFHPVNLPKEQGHVLPDTTNAL